MSEVGGCPDSSTVLSQVTQGQGGSTMGACPPGCRCRWQDLACRPAVQDWLSGSSSVPPKATEAAGPGPTRGPRPTAPRHPRLVAHGVAHQARRAGQGSSCCAATALLRLDALTGPQSYRSALQRCVTKIVERKRFASESKSHGFDKLVQTRRPIHRITPCNRQGD